MQIIHKILVPYDLSEPALSALRQGFLYASHYNASLSVIFILKTEDYFSKGSFSSSPEILEEKIRERINLEIQKNNLKDNFKGVSVEIVLQQAEQPAIEIVSFSEKEKIDLIIMGSHGYHGMKRLWLGSVAERVVQKSEIPVLICRGNGEKLPQKILAPIDFSEHGKEGLELGLNLANQLKADFSLLHVIGLQDLYSVPDLFQGVETSVIDSLKEESEKKLQACAKQTETPVNRETRVGNISMEIDNFVREKGIDLIVMSTHGRSGLKHFLMGSVAEQIVRSSSCSVLTIRPSSLKS